MIWQDSPPLDHQICVSSLCASCILQYLPVDVCKTWSGLFWRNDCIRWTWLSPSSHALWFLTRNDWITCDFGPKRLLRQTDSSSLPGDLHSPFPFSFILSLLLSSFDYSTCSSFRFASCWQPSCIRPVIINKQPSSFNNHSFTSLDPLISPHTSLMLSYLFSSVRGKHWPHNFCFDYFLGINFYAKL